MDVWIEEIQFWLSYFMKAHNAKTFNFCAWEPSYHIDIIEVFSEN